MNYVLKYIAFGSIDSFSFFKYSNSPLYFFGKVRLTPKSQIIFKENNIHSANMNLKTFRKDSLYLHASTDALASLPSNYLYFFILFLYLSS